MQKAIEPPDLSFVLSPAVQRAVLAELRENGIALWTDVAGRQIPAGVIARHMGCGQRALEAFVRRVRENGGCVTMDTPPEWKPYTSKMSDIIKGVRTRR